MSVENEKETSIGTDNKIKAFSFTLKNLPEDGDEPDETDTINEVWLTNNGKLYQISNYANFEVYMGKILQSFRFN